MKYFTYDLISRANGWDSDDGDVDKEAARELEAAKAEYCRELDKVQHRVSSAAWRFFRHGLAETGLHDARLISLQINDNRGCRTSGTTAVAEFLNRTEEFIHRFDMRNVKNCRANARVDESLFERNIGDLYTYELTDAGESCLTLSFLFAAGSEIEVTFERLIYKRSRAAET